MNQLITTSNHQINRILKNKRYYSGCYPIDKFVRLIRNMFPRKKASFIVNYDNSSMNGSHWVCVILDGKKAYNFDSYGLPPKKEILTVLKSKGYDVIGNTEQYQSYEDKWCGWFCIYICNEFSKGRNPVDIILEFEPKEFDENRKKLQTYFLK